MCATLSVPMSMLPQIRQNADDFGTSEESLFGKALPILSAAGDQQSALVGQACLEPGTAKITYGTGAFLVANCGTIRPQSANRLLGTVGYEVAGPGGLNLQCRNHSAMAA